MVHLDEWRGANSGPLTIEWRVADAPAPARLMSEVPAAGTPDALHAATGNPRYLYQKPPFQKMNPRPDHGETATGDRGKWRPPARTPAAFRDFTGGGNRFRQRPAPISRSAICPSRVASAPASRRHPRRKGQPARTGMPRTCYIASDDSTYVSGEIHERNRALIQRHAYGRGPLSSLCFLQGGKRFEWLRSGAYALAGYRGSPAEAGSFPHGTAVAMRCDRFGPQAGRCRRTTLPVSLRVVVLDRRTEI